MEGKNKCYNHWGTLHGTSIAIQLVMRTCPKLYCCFLIVPKGCPFLLAGLLYHEVLCCILNQWNFSVYGNRQRNSRVHQYGSFVFGWHQWLPMPLECECQSLIVPRRPSASSDCANDARLRCLYSGETCARHAAARIWIEFFYQLPPPPTIFCS